MREGSPIDVVTTHKDEKPSRIPADQEDRAKVCQRLQICIIHSVVEIILLT